MLHSFEVIGRFGSISAAAQELHVSPSALSHQLKKLEAFLSTSLYRRVSSGITLTQEGCLLLGALQRGFSEIEKGLQALESGSNERSIKISMLSTFAMRWFIPRLREFQELFPLLRVEISTSTKTVDLLRREADCAVRFGQGEWPRHKSLFLFQESLIPVCSPRYLESMSSLQGENSLYSAQLIRSKLRPDDWKLWFQMNNLDISRIPEGSLYETRSFAIQAAVDGLGFVIMDPQFIQKNLDNGSLVNPFPGKVKKNNGYYFLTTEERAEEEELAILRDWLQEITKSYSKEY